MKSEELNNLSVLGTAVQLISEIAMEVIGADVTTELAGKKVTPSSVTLLATAALNEALGGNNHA